MAPFGSFFDALIPVLIIKLQCMPDHIEFRAVGFFCIASPATHTHID